MYTLLISSTASSRNARLHGGEEGGIGADTLGVSHGTASGADSRCRA